MEAVQTSDPLSPQEILASLRETTASLRETREGLKELRESHKETEKLVRENEQIMKENSRMFGEFTRRFGEVVEHMIAPNLWEKFNELGYDFQRTCNGARFCDQKNNLRFEVDFLIENYSKAMLVEVKNQTGNRVYKRSHCTP
jgi:arsenate reductase-like glutaredoxin family protein